MSKCSLRPDYVPLLQRLLEPSERESVLARTALETGLERAVLESMFETLLRAEVVESSPDDATRQSAGYDMCFCSLLRQRFMLQDTGRNEAFAEAIAKVVRPGDTVFDVGAGSGFLSLLAARAGAAKVVGLESTGIIEDARQIVKDNGFSNVIEYHQADAAAYRTELRADLIVGEWIGRFVVDEWRHFNAFAAVRDRLLKPGGRVMPEWIKLYLVPIDDNRLYMDGIGFWSKPVCGVNFTHGRKLELASLQHRFVKANERTFVTDPWEVLHLDAMKSDARAYEYTFSNETTLRQSGTINGFVGYFDALLGAGVHLHTGPGKAPTSFNQDYFAVDAFVYQPGDVLVTHSRCKLQECPVISLEVALSRKGSPVHSAQYSYRLDRVPMW